MPGKILYVTLNKFDESNFASAVTYFRFDVDLSTVGERYLRAPNSFVLLGSDGVNNNGTTGATAFPSNFWCCGNQTIAFSWDPSAGGPPFPDVDVQIELDTGNYLRPLVTGAAIQGS
jgi:hypothetical protein